MAAFVLLGIKLFVLFSFCIYIYIYICKCFRTKSKVQCMLLYPHAAEYTCERKRAILSRSS